jgi:hypothetical protein
MDHLKAVVEACPSCHKYGIAPARSAHLWLMNCSNCGHTGPVALNEGSAIRRWNRAAAAIYDDPADRFDDIHDI